MQLSYVYAHVKPSNEIFYIGKGKDKRAWSKKDRNLHWHNIVKKHGYSVVILADNLTDEYALIEEQLLIKHFKKFKKLCNQTDGGEGASGFKHSKEFCDNRSLYMKSNLNPMKNPEVAKKLGLAISGKNHPTQKEGYINKTTGENNGMFGRTGGLHWHAKQIVFEGLSFNSIKEASAHFNIEYNKFYRLLNKK
jgi:hypothetical protein